MAMCKLVCPRAAIQHNANIRYPFLLILIRKQNVLMMCARPPIDGARRITRMIFSDAKEFRPRAASPCGNRPRIDARAPRMNRYMPQSHYRWEDEQLSLGLQLDL